MLLLPVRRVQPEAERGRRSGSDNHRSAGDSQRRLPSGRPELHFHRSIELLPHRDAAWPIFDERFQGLEEFSGQLAAADTRKLGLDEVHASIRRLSEGMREPRGVKGRA